MATNSYTKYDEDFKKSPVLLYQNGTQLLKWMTEMSSPQNRSKNFKNAMHN